jgi:hypothetical protein
MSLAALTKDELTQLLQTARQEAAEIEAVIEPIENMERDIRILQANEPPEKMTGGAKFGWGVLFVFLSMGISLIGYAAVGNSDAVCAIVLILALIASFLIVRHMSKKKKQTYANWQARMAQLHEQVQAQDAVLAQTIQRVANKIMEIPEEYRYSFALDTMLGFLRNFRAASWKECVDMCEEQKHRWLLEQNSNEGLLLQRQMSQSSERAAARAEAAAFFGAVTAVNTGILAHRAASNK